MSFPTLLSPWYVVQSLNKDTMSYYSAADENAGMMTDDKGKAMIFMSLTAAHRVGASEGAEIRVLVDRDAAKEFRRE